MKKPLLRIPYTGPLPPPQIIPRNANTTLGAIAALTKFLTTPPSAALRESTIGDAESTVLITGAGISVASGLADYRGVNGTYRVNATYRPIYHHEFLHSHSARKRYWARSFLGWTNLHKARPNPAHYAIRDLGEMGIVKNVITQNVDSFHRIAHPDLKTLELHGYLRGLVCVSCGNELERGIFQGELSRLNPAWQAFLEEAVASGALGTEDPEEKRKRGMKTNPDGDVDLPDAPYSTFRYPACPICLPKPPILADGTQSIVEVDHQGAWEPISTAGVLKPAVVMFGESIAGPIKDAAEQAIDGSGKLLVLGTSLATYSAWRLARRARERGMPIGIINLGGVRGEELFFDDRSFTSGGEAGVRVESPTNILLPNLVNTLRQLGFDRSPSRILDPIGAENRINSAIFKDMLS